MMTQEQITGLAKYFQIDNFTIVREYLQLLFLNCLYRDNEATKVFFKGGTALRLLFLSPCFSEDLDFSSTFSKEEITQIVKRTEKLMRRDLPEIKIIFLYSGREGLRFRMDGVRLDFNIVKKVKKPVVLPMTTRFPIIIFPLINCLSVENIFAEKLMALGTRDKGRDFYDIWFLLQRKIAFDKKFVTENLLKKITAFPETKLESDLRPFLPQSQRKIIPILKEELVCALR